MMHLTFADKSLLIDDATARALLLYTQLLAQGQDADSVTVKAVGADGQDVEAILLLDTGTPLMAETTHSTLNEPDNFDVLAYLNERIRQLQSPFSVQPQENEPSERWDDLEL